MIWRVLTKFLLSKILKKIIKFKPLKNNNQINQKNWLSYRISSKGKRTILQKVKMKKRNCNLNLKIWRKKTPNWKCRFRRAVLRSTWILLVRKKIIKDFCISIRLPLSNACRCTLSSVWTSWAEVWAPLWPTLTSNILRCNRCQVCLSNNLLTLCSSILWQWARCKCL